MTIMIPMEDKHIRWNEATLAPIRLKRVYDSASISYYESSIPSRDKELNQATPIHEGSTLPLRTARSDNTPTISENRKTKTDTAAAVFSSTSGSRRLSEDSDRIQRHKEVLKALLQSPEWDFRHNNAINLRHQSSSEWFGELLTSRAASFFGPLEPARKDGDALTKMSSAVSNSSGFVTWFERDVQSGDIMRDQLFSPEDENMFFCDPGQDHVDAIDSNRPITLAEFLVNVDQTRSFKNPDNCSHASFVEKFPSFHNVNLTELNHPTYRMIADLAESLRNDVIDAFSSTMKLDRHVKDRNKEISFIDRFLRGKRWERFKIRKHFSSEVGNVCKFPIPLVRKWDEFVIAVAEELPPGQISLTEGLSKNDEMRFIYQIYGMYSHMSRRAKLKDCRNPAYFNEAQLKGEPTSGVTLPPNKDFRKRIFSVINARKQLQAAI